ncbi:unnamed protein product [Symbiodinium pilosum]|uniref:Uncharacterized protein n=1 Tax=Symbiodinium pilosum TaxID=2952 RepID=A0A812QAC5_SYMPI|nr:unnamed protein product [Symbiodinium pilosum]
MGNCVHPEIGVGHEERFPAQVVHIGELVKPSAIEPIQSEVDVVDEDAETLAGSEIFTLERSSRSLSSESSSPLTPLSSATDFSGKWVCSRVEGDWEAYLRERGTSWMMRRLAASIGYGVGKHTQTIMQNADELEVFNLVVSTGPPKEERCVIKADGTEQEILDPDGLLFRQKTRWMDGVLVSEQFQSGAHVPCAPVTLKRFMQGHEMCTERTTAKGVMVRRFYIRA